MRPLAARAGLPVREHGMDAAEIPGKWAELSEESSCAIAGGSAGFGS